MMPTIIADDAISCPCFDVAKSKTKHRHLTDISWRLLGDDFVSEQRTELVAQPCHAPQYLSEEETPAPAEEFHVIGLLNQLQSRLPLLHHVPVTQPGADLRLSNQISPPPNRVATCCRKARTCFS